MPGLVFVLDPMDDSPARHRAKPARGARRAEVAPAPSAQQQFVVGRGFARSRLEQPQQIEHAQPGAFRVGDVERNPSPAQHEGTVAHVQRLAQASLRIMV